MLYLPLMSNQPLYYIFFITGIWFNIAEITYETTNTITPINTTASIGLIDNVFNPKRIFNCSIINRCTKTKF